MRLHGRQCSQILNPEPLIILTPTTPLIKETRVSEPLHPAIHSEPTPVKTCWPSSARNRTKARAIPEGLDVHGFRLRPLPRNGELFEEVTIELQSLRVRVLEPKLRM